MPPPPPGPATLMDRVVQLQQLDHPASAVRRFCRQVPGSLAARLDGDAPGHSDLLARLADLAYGYRVTPRGLARRAASAGAMYPIELAWITHDGTDWRYRYFDPTRQQCVDLTAPAGPTAHAMRLTPGQHALVLVSIAWRTIQRYGVRGYRYCLLDAGNVLGNVAAVTVAAGGHLHLPETVPTDLIHRDLSLTRDELVTGVAVVQGGELDAVLPRLSACPPGDQSGPGRYFGTEQPPMLTPALERIRRLHRLADPGRQHPLNFRLLLGGQSAHQSVRHILLRRSARAFTGAELSPAGLAVLDEYQHRVVQAVPSPLARRLAVRLVSRRDAAWQARWFDHGSLVWRTEPVAEPAPADLISMFGVQPIAATATAFLVVGAHGEDGTHGDPRAYRQSLLTAGVACAGAYQVATRTDLATTTLGGFDDDRVATLAAGDFVPLVVQAFGVGADASRDDKNDTVAANWLRAHDNRGTA
jgi:hypothetical protein